MKSWITLLFCLLIATNAFSTPVTGIISDSQTREPISFATVSVLTTGHSTSANELGEYILHLPSGDYRIKFSHVAHYSETIDLTVGDTAMQKDISLRPALVEVSGFKVYNRNYDAAQRIIVEAIARKEQILSQIQEYRFEAYTKIVVRDTAKADSAEIAVIAESQLEAFWKYPDSYKEIIVARKQSSNIEARNNLISVGEILNFNKNRIDFDRYAIVSPTATDALDYYNYYLLDTIEANNRRIFLLEIEPKDPTDALFEGTIRIVDSAFAVVGVDVAFSEGFDHPFLREPRYVQIYSETPENYWMPSLIQFTGIFHLKPLPVFAFDYQASLHSYRFDLPVAEDEFDEYALEVDDRADDVDSAVWIAGQVMPLTEMELYGYFRIDSVENNLPILKRAYRLLGQTMLLLSFGAKDFVHFNRVEGLYLGAGHTFDINKRFDLRAKSGYAFDADLWQHSYGLNFLAAERQKLSLDVEYRYQVRTRPTVFSPADGDPTFMAIVNKTDAYDYHLEDGLVAKIETKVVDLTRLSLSFNNLIQQSRSNSTEYSIARKTKLHRPNPEIVNGRLRSLELSFRYDSRRLVREKGRDRKFSSFPLTLFETGIEYASPDLIDNDFEFTRYYASLFRMQRLFGWIVNTVYLYGGASDKYLPPQRYFTVDFDAGIAERPISLHTMGENNFSGNRTLVAYTHFDFDRKLFQKSKLPLIEDIPLSLQIYGCMFWSDFKNHTYNPGDELLLTAPKPYCEVGFSVGRLLPFGLGLGFNWQLSDYDTYKFVWGPSMTMLFF